MRQWAALQVRVGIGAILWPGLPDYSAVARGQAKKTFQLLSRWSFFSQARWSGMMSAAGLWLAVPGMATTSASSEFVGRLPTDTRISGSSRLIFSKHRYAEELPVCSNTRIN